MRTPSLNMYRRFLAITTFVAALACGFCRASDLNPQFLGNWPGETRGLAQNVFPSGSLLYVGATNGLTIVDNSDPENRVTLGAFKTTNSVICVQVVGSIAYVAANRAGLYAIDVSDLTKPRQIGYYDTPGSAQRFAIVGSRLYLTDFGSGLEIFDISDPTNLRRLGTYDTPGNCRDVVVDKGMAYVADQSFGLSVINVAIPSTPSLYTLLNNIGSVSSVAYNGTTLCVTILTGEILLYDLRNIGVPNPTGALYLTGLPTSVAVNNNIAVVASDSAGLHILDISDPGHMVKLATYVTPSRAIQVVLSGSRAYVGTSATGIQVVDISNPSAPVLVEKFGLGDARDVAGSGDYAFLADGYAGLRIFDVKSPQSPKLLRTISNIEARSVALKNDLAYVAAGADGLKIYDVRNPAVPQLLATYFSDAPIASARIRDTNVVALTTGRQWDTLDVSNPSDPRRIAVHNAFYTMQDVAFFGDYAYALSLLGGTGGAMDIQPRETGDALSSFGNVAAAFSIAFLDHYCLVASTDQGLRILDFANPTNVVFGTTLPGSSMQVVPFGGYAFMSMVSGGVSVVDLRNIASPKLVGSCVTTGPSSRIGLARGRIYVTDERQGFSILSIPPELLPPVSLKGVVGGANTPFQVRVEGGAGLSGRVERATSLGSWTTWQPVAIGDAPVEIPDPEANAQSFYRFVSP